MSKTLVVPASVERVVISYLAPLLDPVPVSQTIPPDRPATFITVQRTGGMSATLVTDWAQITVDTWGPDAPTAADLSNLI